MTIMTTFSYSYSMTVGPSVKCLFHSKRTFIVSGLGTRLLLSCTSCEYYANHNVLKIKTHHLSMTTLQKIQKGFTDTS